VANLSCHSGHPGTPAPISALPAWSLARRGALRPCAARLHCVVLRCASCLDGATAPLEMTNRRRFPAFPSERRHHIPAAPLCGGRRERVRTPLPPARADRSGAV
jgi:hypothetical protein